jgi:hypothetical protein
MFFDKKVHKRKAWCGRHVCTWTDLEESWYWRCTLQADPTPNWLPKLVRILASFRESSPPADGYTTTSSNNNHHKHGMGRHSPLKHSFVRALVMLAATNPNRETSIVLGLIPGLCAQKPANQLPELWHDRNMAWFFCRFLGSMSGKIPWNKACPHYCIYLRIHHSKTIWSCRHNAVK